MMTKSQDGFKNGWFHKSCSCSLILLSLFRSSSPTSSSSPSGRRTSRRMWNKLMHALNGNLKRKKAPVPVNAPSFNVIHQNIPGKKTKKDVGHFIETIILRFKPAILFISEADPDLIETVTPPGYVFHRGTLPGKSLIRICMLIKVTEQYEIIEANVDVPTVAVKIQDWTFVGVYREWTHAADPATKDRRDLELIRLKTFVKWWRSKLRGKAIVMGDFNFDPADPVTTHQKSLKHIREHMETCIIERNWTQLITEITRSQRGQESGLLDHIYINREDFVEHVFRENCTGTDHYAVGVKVRLKDPVFVSETFLARNIDGIPKGAFEFEFCNSKLSEIYRADNINEALRCLEFKMLRAANIVAPERRVRTQEYYAKWMTAELQLKVKKRNALRLRAEKSKLQEHWYAFKEYQRTLCKELRTAREEDLKADMDVKNAKVRWQRVRQHTKLNKKAKSQDIELNLDGEKVSEPSIVAKTLNNYFKEKVVKLRADLDVSVADSLSYTDEYLLDKEVKEFEFKQVSRTYVKGIIRNLTNTGALGRDGLGTKLIKRYRHVLAGPITHIVNMAIYFGEYPDDWKLGIICPIPKGGDPTEMKNWRPICINTAMSKVLETVLNNQISWHMESTGLYSETQHAYRKVRSVSTALIELDTLVKDQLNKGKTVAIVTTDISAGFNLVSKEILIPKMAKFGFGEMSCQLLENYLTRRRTQVKIKNIKSGEVVLDTGVGEGSVLGPNFFSCGMTDVSVVAKRVMSALEDSHNFKVYITQIEYADDCTGIIAADNEDELQVAADELLKGFSRFYSANGLKLNEQKCHILVLRPHKKVKTITLAGQDEVPWLRLLGLFIDNKLNYEKHTQVVCGRLTAKIRALEKLKNKASYKTLKEVTVSLVHSTIEFCGELYLRTFKNQKAVQKKLNSAMRMLQDPEDYEASCTQMMWELRWLNVANMWRWCSIRTLKRILGKPDQVPYLAALINLNKDTHYRVRYNALKTHWRKLTRWARESYLFSVTQLYNSLGLHGRLFADYEDMRDQIKNKLILTFGNKNLK